MSDLLEGIQQDLRARLDELRPLVSEYEQLRQAVAALEGVPSARESSAAKPRARSAPLRKRAPAGTNRERVLAAVRGNPGATASRIAEASGVQRTVVYGVLRRLGDDGVIEKRDDPETGTSYALASAEQGDESATDGQAISGEPAGDAGAQQTDAPDRARSADSGHAAVGTDSMDVYVDNGAGVPAAPTGRSPRHFAT